MSQMPLGFIPEPITVHFDKLLPSRKAPDGLLNSRKFKQILSSIDAVGLIEPLTIGKADKVSGMHLLLDGHIRMLALKELGFSDALCLIATDDESYTYNNRVNRLSSIQEHFMICRAVARRCSIIAATGRQKNRASSQTRMITLTVWIPSVHQSMVMTLLQ